MGLHMAHYQVLITFSILNILCNFLMSCYLSVGCERGVSNTSILHVLAKLYHTVGVSSSKYLYLT